ncbi:hypothetical protein CCHR01_16459 [Colletotrichum chrysophilum]|uniref:Uncharacterized protein n=1 Tax=Colletotrichum chrysophilum TaxID=1836956 RepID=A0AAD9A6C0_9PEZI|nr:hypothetical protein K456DRAFT_53180 [Colletotrichum gloeosporioides 23]KAK1840907.1 hypothetical protein CCHR01_16459 [Colletotrichum chrysophilum]
MIGDGRRGCATALLVPSTAWAGSQMGRYPSRTPGIRAGDGGNIEQKDDNRMEPAEVNQTLAVRPKNPTPAR